jgi:dihydroxyacetone kinase-like protein
VLVEKIAGAAAEAGAPLGEVQAVAQRVNEQGRSMGLALSSCVVPSAGTPTFDLADDEVEVGIGIHGEPGRRRQELAPVDEMAEWLVSPIVSDLSLTRGETVLALVNGMGGTPLIELYIAFGSVARILAGRGIRIGRNLVGNHITSLEMAGFSVTLLRLDDELVRLWDAPVCAPGLRWGM